MESNQTGSVFSLICLVRSTPAHTFLLISGGVIPEIKYKSSTFVDLRHPVIDRHVWFSSGSRRCACDDRAHTGAAYSAVE